MYTFLKGISFSFHSGSFISETESSVANPKNPKVVAPLVVSLLIAFYADVFYHNSHLVVSFSTISQPLGKCLVIKFAWNGFFHLIIECFSKRFR